MLLFVVTFKLKNGLTYPNQMIGLCLDYLVDGLGELCTKSVERFFIYNITFLEFNKLRIILLMLSN